MVKYDFYSDPSHGWLKVKRKELEKLGIASKISGYSYQHGNFVYLEEDSDASLFVNTLKARGQTIEIVEHTSNSSSHIRNYDSYDENKSPYVYFNSGKVKAKDFNFGGN